MNQAGFDLLRAFEKCSLNAYKDVGKVWTIGWGHTGDVMPNQVITQEHADALLLQDLGRFETAVSDLVKVRLKPNQEAALICFAYNVGVDAFANSTLLKCLNVENFDDAADELLRWTKVKNKECSGLFSRRLAERRLFLST